MRVIAWTVSVSALLHVAFTPLAGLLGIMASLLAPPPPPELEAEQLRSIPITLLSDAELAALAGRGAIVYRKTATRDAGPHWQGDRGRINRAQLEALVERPEDTLCFVCGPAALVHEVPRMLEEIGVARDRIRVEEWALPRTS